LNEQISNNQDNQVINDLIIQLIENNVEPAVLDLIDLNTIAENITLGCTSGNGSGQNTIVGPDSCQIKNENECLNNDTCYWYEDNSNDPY